MALDPTLPTDAIGAQKLLAELETKDQQAEICRYPTCHVRRRISENGGMPPVYCENEKHTAKSNFRARAFIRDLAKGLPSMSLETEQAVTTHMVLSLRDVSLVRMENFQEALGMYVAAIRELSDPEVASAQIEAAQHRADASIAIAQENMERERSLRLLAEQAQATAQQDAQVARQEASLAITKMQEAETRIQQQQEVHTLQLTTLQLEHEQTIETIRSDARQQVEAIQQDAEQAIMQAQEDAAIATEQAQQANMRAHEAATEARTQIESAHLLVKEARSTLLREQEEIARLRQESAMAATEAHSRAETDRAEIERLRTTLAETILDARTRGEDDRLEIQRLRASLNAATERADEQARANDLLRTQIVETRREKPE